ncbi:MAG: DUF58 domain-containing protein [Verrucomicrobiota bacterium]
MIVPRTRLLFWVAMVLLPFALLFAVNPAAAVLSMLLISAFFLLVAVDAVLAFRSMDGISIELPELVRLSSGREGRFDLKIKNGREKHQRLRLGLAFPRGFISLRDDQMIVLPAGSKLSRLSWPCRAVKRGNYTIDRCYLESESPLGLWSFQTAMPAQMEIRVYPNLLTERKHLAALFLNRGSFGIHAQRQVGQGREFERLREYIPGDGYDEIHWKATAKRGHPVTKVFQIERTQEIYVILDASRLSARNAGVPVASPESRVSSLKAETVSVDDHKERSTGLVNGASTLSSPPSITVLERCVTAALILGLAAEQQGDLFGLLTFTDKVERFVRAKNGKAHYGVCRDALYTLEPHVVTPDFDEVCAFIRLHLRRRALLVFLTALDDPVLAESFIRNIDLIRRQHLVLVNMLQPEGARPLFSDLNVDSLDDLYRHLGGHIRWHNLRELERVLQRRGVRFSFLENERMSAQLVSQYLSVKQRQLL